jgi:acetyl esterase
MHAPTESPQPFVRADVAGFLGFLSSLPGPKTHELSPENARQVMVAMKDVADLPPGELAVMRDLTVPGADGDLPARLFDARDDRVAGPLVLFFHGGGFVIGSTQVYAGFCAEMARALDLPVLSVDYRLAPEAKWPAAPDDCEAAARWAAQGPDALGRKVSSLVLAGDSAGGTLAIITAMALRDDPAAVPVIAQLPIYPAADLESEHPSFDQFADGYLLTRQTMDWFDDHYGADLTHARGNPMRGSVAGLPPALVVTASLDPLRDQGRAYAAALANAGVPVHFREAVGNIHGFITLRKAIPSSVGDVGGMFRAFRSIVEESEADRVMHQAAGTD